MNRYVKALECYLLLKYTISFLCKVLISTLELEIIIESEFVFIHSTLV